jgi:hypothetical protein
VYLADKSALTQHETRPEVREIVEPLLLAGRIATCGIVDLELLFSATGPAVYTALASALRATFGANRLGPYRGRAPGSSSRGTAAASRARGSSCATAARTAGGREATP